MKKIDNICSIYYYVVNSNTKPLTLVHSVSFLQSYPYPQTTIVLFLSSSLNFPLCLSLPSNLSQWQNHAYSLNLHSSTPNPNPHSSLIPPNPSRFKTHLTILQSFHHLSHSFPREEPVILLWLHLLHKLLIGLNRKRRKMVLHGRIKRMLHGLVKLKVTRMKKLKFPVLKNLLKI